MRVLAPARVLSSALEDADGRTLTVENYDSQPVRLTNVRVSARK